MENLMKAIVLSEQTLKVQNVKKPQETQADHLIIKMDCSAINSGDKFFLKYPSPPGAVQSLYDIKGVSGVGKVIQIGEGVPLEYLGKSVTIYRNLRYSESAIGTWCEYSHVHFLDCAILPDGVNPEDYSGSMVNIITPFAFYKEILDQGHQGIISTAGNSATGIALLGICLTYNFPLISIVRNAESKKQLEELGAKNIVVQSEQHFGLQLKKMAQELETTAIFDGVGGEILNQIIDMLPNDSVIYSYGYLGDQIPLTIQTSTLSLKNLIIKPFSNLKTNTVQNPQNLEKALKEIAGLIHMPHFKTKTGKRFKLEEINDALFFNSGKAILYHS
ncbi:hypothetical protein [Pedobacter sp. NJ-S-72]